MLRVGLVGCGYIGSTFHIPAWQKISEAKIISVCDQNISRAEYESKKLNISSYDSYTDMLKNESLDIIDICTPNELHLSQILEALNNNCHVIVEKPIVTKAKDVDRIIATAKKNNKKVMCAQHQRFRPESVKAREIIKSGQLGKIYYIRAKAIKCKGLPLNISSYVNKSLSGGGALIDLGIHLLDLSWWLLGCPKPVHAFCSTADNISNLIFNKVPGQVFDVEEFSSALLKFNDNSTISLEISYLLNNHKDEFGIELLGDKGGLLWPELILTKNEGERMLRSAISIDDECLASVEELSHFTKCVMNNLNTNVPLEESREGVRMIEALYESALSGNSIHFL